MYVIKIAALAMLLFSLGMAVGFYSMMAILT